MSTPVSQGSRAKKKEPAFAGSFDGQIDLFGAYLQRLNEPIFDFMTLPFGASTVGLYVVFT